MGGEEGRRDEDPAGPTALEHFEIPDSLEGITEKMGEASRYYATGIGWDFGQAVVSMKDHLDEPKTEFGVFLHFLAKPICGTEDIQHSYFFGQQELGQLAGMIAQISLQWMVARLEGRTGEEGMGMGDV